MQGTIPKVVSGGPRVNLERPTRALLNDFVVHEGPTYLHRRMMRRWCRTQPLSLFYKPFAGTLQTFSVVRHMSISRHDWPNGWIRCKLEWMEMDLETQLLWRVLGWKHVTWDDKRIPKVSSQRWEELGDEQRRAASELGYDKHLWDAEDRFSQRKPLHRAVRAQNLRRWRIWTESRAHKD